MTKKEAIERFKGIINAMSISIAQSKFYPSKAELNELCDMAIEALSAENSNAKTQNSNQETQKSNGETIKWLESLKAEIGKSEHRALWHYAEAIDMAIEALSADRNILDELQRRFEEEEHKAFENDKTGLKEHVVWNRAIRILEEYME